MSRHRRSARGDGMVGHAQLRFGTSGHRLFTIAAPRDAGHDGIEVRGFGHRASQLAPRIIGAAGRESKVVWLASFLAEIWRDNRCLVSERAASYTGIEN